MKRKRLNNEGSTYLQSNGLWCHAFIAGGKRRYCRAKTATAAREKAEKQKLRHAQGQPMVDTTDTVSEYLDLWVGSELKAHNQKRAIKPTTLAFYQRFIRVHLKPALGLIKLAKLNKAQVQGWVNDLEDRVSPVTVHHAYKLLRRALAAAVPDMIVRNPTDKVTLIPLEKKEVQPMTTEQQADFFKAADQTPLATLYRVMFLLGLRKGEVLALKWTDVDEKKGQVTIRGSVARYRLQGKGVTPDGKPVMLDSKLEILTPKTEKSWRRFPLTGELAKLLAAHKSKLAKYVLKAGKDALVFPSTRGTIMEPRNLNRHFSKVLKAAGLPENFWPHLMRHGTATEMLKNGVSLNDVSKYLGHSQIGITADIYGHVVEEQKQKALEVMEQHMTAVAGGSA